MFWGFLLYSYLITTGISISVMPIRAYFIGKNKDGKRISIIRSFEIAAICLIPYLAFYAFLYVSYLVIKKRLNSWIKADPTNPKNIADPDFVPPPKKEKKFKPIKDRFDILDL